VARGERALATGSIEGRREARQLVQRSILARDRVSTNLSDRNDEIVEEAPLPCRDGALVALECDPILIGSRGAPFLLGDLRVLTHALAGRAICDRGNVELDIANLQVGEVRNTIRERARLLEPANPIRKTLAKTKLDPAHALGPADERKRAIDAVDHPGGLDR